MLLPLPDGPTSSPFHSRAPPDEAANRTTVPLLATCCSIAQRSPVDTALGAWARSAAPDIRPTDQCLRRQAPSKVQFLHRRYVYPWRRSAGLLSSASCTAVSGVSGRLSASRVKTAASSVCGKLRPWDAANWAASLRPQSAGILAQPLSPASSSALGSNSNRLETTSEPPGSS